MTQVTTESPAPLQTDAAQQIDSLCAQALPVLGQQIDAGRAPGEGSLSSAIRVYVVGRLRGLLRQTV